MSRWIMIVDPANHRTYGIDDMHVLHDLRRMVQSGETLLGESEIWQTLGARPWPLSPLRQPVMVIVLGSPPVMLSGRHYSVLLGLARGQKSDQIARRLGISRRTVYEYINDLKARFQVQSRSEVLVQAMHCGMLDPLTRGSAGQPSKGSAE